MKTKKGIKGVYRIAHRMSIIPLSWEGYGAGRTSHS